MGCLMKVYQTALTWHKGVTLYSQPSKANGKEDQAGDDGQMSPVTNEEGK